MKRILTAIALALPLAVATSLPKPASALEATNNPQTLRASDKPEYIAQYYGQYQQRDQGRYREQDRGRYQPWDQGRYGEQYGRQYQYRQPWVAGHYEYRNHRRVFVPGHYEYR
ncbi:MAG: hypothetical protein JOZ78_10945 [Chroococcidiopsidaceae cyanobacterium CP_BM_ER_R8_30]|nr:hypothetical protein [Chroococcidiopsidaceae cyanobacterium CP_BM_ER_R8_30]